jgi:hypothetical protein
MKTILILAMAAAASAAPVIRDLQPRGAQRGRTLMLTLKGDGLTPGAELRTTLPAGVSRLAPPKDAPRPESELPFLVEIRKDAPIGFYPVRLVTADGISNVMLFSVGDLPEVDEVEARNPKADNGTPKDAQPLTLPVVVNGELAPADVDLFSFTVKAGEKLVFEVEARRAGSAVDAAIEILDAAGKVIARNDDGISTDVDPRFEVAFPKAGQYFARIHDSKYSDQAQNFYRLRIGAYPYAESIFPLGARRGEQVDVTLAGGNLAQPVKVRVDTSGAGRYVPVSLPGSLSPPLVFVAGDLPEALEPDAPGPHALADGVVMNGRISRPGEIDRYRVAVRPGEHWMFEVEAAALGTSQLDAILTAYDAAGIKIASRDDIAAPDPALPLRIPEGVSEVTVAVEDVLARGGAGFGYRLLARRQPADFTLDLATPFVNVPAGGTAQVVVAMQRRGYDGPVRLLIPNLPPGFQVHGGDVPSEAAAQNFSNENAGFRAARGVLTIAASEDAPSGPLEIAVAGIADTPDGRLERLARGSGMVVAVRGLRQRAFTAPWLDMKLPLAVARPAPARLSAGAGLVRISQGFEYTLSYRLERASGSRLIGRVRNQQVGGVGNIRILQGPPGRTPDQGAILVSTNFDTPVTAFNMLLEATVEGADGKQSTVTAPMVRVEVVQGFQVRLDRPVVEIAPDSRAELRGTVYREPTFQGGLVQVRAQDLPDGLRCDDVDVAADRREFVLACEASASVQAGAHEIRIASSAPDTGRANAKDTYKIPDIAAKLVVAGERRALR